MYQRESYLCKVTFGAELKDYEVYEFVLKNYYRLRFNPTVVTDVKEAGSNLNGYSEKYGNNYSIPR